jgi:hypothetical protein
MRDSGKLHDLMKETVRCMVPSRYLKWQIKLCGTPCSNQRIRRCNQRLQIKTARPMLSLICTRLWLQFRSKFQLAMYVTRINRDQQAAAVAAVAQLRFSPIT